MKLRSYTAWIIGLAVVGCVTMSEPLNQSFKISEQEFRQTIHTIALAPLEPPAGLNNADYVKQSFESMIETQLTRGGYTVVPSKRYEELQAKLIEQSGGFYDIRTGKPNPDQAKAMHEKTLKGLREQFHADAVLYPAFGVFKVSIAGGRAAWHGAQEPIAAGSNEVTRSLTETVFPGSGSAYEGTTTALSLGVTIENLQRVELYKKWAGIQLRAKQEPGGGSRKPVELPPADLLQNEARNQAAVESALADLIPPGASPAAGSK
ncbi:MAG: hypothetical protein HY208_07660 [Nitrospirae bacterium]|nr:hypothetical protein [Nitrospirota bacterium]